MTGVEDLKDTSINLGRLRLIALKVLSSELTVGWFAIQLAEAKFCKKSGIRTRVYLFVY